MVAVLRSAWSVSHGARLLGKDYLQAGGSGGPEGDLTPEDGWVLHGQGRTGTGTHVPLVASRGRAPIGHDSVQSVADDVDVDVAHPLAGTLEVLRRHDRCHRISVSGPSIGW